MRSTTFTRLLRAANESTGNRTYDLRGNLLSDSLFDYEWNELDRPTAVEVNSSVAEAYRVRLEFAYDPAGRRTHKTVKTRAGGAWTAGVTTRFVWDGWLLIAELNAADKITRSYVWGQDLSASGTFDAAGGVGGLRAVREHNPATGAIVNTWYATHDENGNVASLVDAATGAVTAHYQYTPFGAPLATDGPDAAVCPFGFSTKYYDSEVGLYYYGYRYYDPRDARWLNRDPLAEDGGLNLYGFCGGDPINTLDPLGLEITRGQLLKSYKAVYGHQDIWLRALWAVGCTVETGDVLGDFDIDGLWSKKTLQVEEDIPLMEAVVGLRGLVLQAVNESPAAREWLVRKMVERDGRQWGGGGAANAGTVARARRRLHELRRDNLANLANQIQYMSELYWGSIGIFNEGTDFMITIDEVSKGNLTAVVGFLPFVPAIAGKPARIALRKGGDALGFLARHVDDIPGKQVTGWLWRKIPKKYLDDVVASFKLGKAKRILLDEDLLVVRHWGGESQKVGAPYFALRQYDPTMARKVLALPDGNTAKNISYYKIPKGTEVLVGDVGPRVGTKGYGKYARGGATQVYVPGGWDILEEVVLK